MAKAMAATSGSPQVHFMLVVALGWLLSAGWFLSQLIITHLQEADSEIVNYAGRLRFLTQNVGLLFISKQLSLPQPGLTNSSSLEDDISMTFEKIDSVRDGLLGTEGASMSTVPEISDTNVKAALERWIRQHLEPLREQVRKPSGAVAGQQLAAFVDEVNLATRILDNVVDQASWGARKRVHTLFFINISRAIWGVIWTACAAAAFYRVWRLYMTSYYRLQDTEQKLYSLLRAAYDVVVPVRPTAPFDVLDCERELSLFVGRPIASRSILDCTCGSQEAETLQDFLQRGLHSGVWKEGADDLESCCRVARPLMKWWWPRKLLGKLPVASMIHSRWAMGSAEVHDRPVVEVEILMVSGGPKQESTLLAVRRVGIMEEPDPSLPLSPLPERAQPGPLLLPGPALAARRGPPLVGSPRAQQVASNRSDVSTEEMVGAVGVVALTPLTSVEHTPPPSFMNSLVVSMARQPGRDAAADEAAVRSRFG